MRTIRQLLAAFLFGVMLLAVSTQCHACNFGYNAGYGYASSYVSVQSYAYMPTVAYFYAAPAPVAYTYAAPCPTAAYAPPAQAEAYTSGVPVTTAETAILQTYNLPQAVNYLTTTYGCSAYAALSTLRVIGHREAALYTGSANALIVDQRRGFFGRNRTTVIAANGNGAVAVEVGRRSFFGRRSVVRTRTVIR